MRLITKTFAYLQVAALCLVTALADPNLQEKNFSGPIRSSETATFEGTTMFVDGNGTGHAQHLGSFTYSFVFVVDASGVGVGSAEFTAANGDTLVTEITAIGDPAGHVVEEHTIVSGTGRFADASGNFTLDRLITFATSLSLGTVEGTIVTPK